MKTSRFREDARRIIRDAVGATSSDHVVLFAGAGSTGAIDRLISCLEIRIPAGLDDRHGLSAAIPAAARPVVNFNYFISEGVFDFILGAVELVASDGWRLLPHYRFEPSTGLWRHAAGTAEPPLSLRDVRFTGGGMTWPSHRRTEPESALGGYLEEARRVLADPPRPALPPEAPVVDADFETLRWFPLPSELAGR